MTTEAGRAITNRFLKSYRLLYAQEKVTNKRDFCQRVSMHPQNFSIMEAGHLCCTIENIYQLAGTFGVSLDWLFFERGEFLSVS